MSWVTNRTWQNSPFIYCGSPVPLWSLNPSIQSPSPVLSHSKTPQEGERTEATPRTDRVSALTSLSSRLQVLQLIPSRVWRNRGVMDKCMSSLFPSRSLPLPGPSSHTRFFFPFLFVCKFIMRATWWGDRRAFQGAADGRGDGRAAGGGARGLWTAGLVSRRRSGGLRTCCNTAAGRTASGSLSGTPEERQRSILYYQCSDVIQCWSRVYTGYQKVIF